MTGQLRKTSPRYTAWRAVLESDRVPLLRSPAPDDEHYLIDTRRLTLVQRGRLVRYFSRRWNVTHEETLRRIDDPDICGAPIDCEDVAGVAQELGFS